MKKDIFDQAKLSLLEQSILEARIETAQNKIRQEHNEIESKRIFGKKHYFAYDSKKFIAMIKLFRT